MPLRYLITGATGFIGAHLVKACLQRGYDVVALACPNSQTESLRELGAQVHSGDSQVAALEDVDVVVNCAAATSGLQILLDGCKGHALGRFVQMSCTAVYPANHHFGADEETPLPSRHRDPTLQAKVECERLALKYYRDYGVPVVVLRPGFVYGPREQHFMPGLIDTLQKRRFRYPGTGRGALDTLFIRNLLDALFLAVDNPQAVGKTYNLTDGEFVSKRRFVEAVASALGLPPPRATRPLWLARLYAWRSDAAAAELRLLGLNRDFSIDRARQELGYRPRCSFDDGIAETMAWYKTSGRQ